MFLRLRPSLIALALSLLASYAGAVPVYLTNVDLGTHGTGTRSVGSGLTGGGNYGLSQLTVDWEITEDNGEFTYTYTFSNVPAPAISHVIVQVSQRFTIDNVLDETGSGFIEDGNPKVHDSDTPGNTGLPSDIYGLKFEELPDGNTVTVSFVSDIAPMWGLIYGKGGSTSFFYSNGFADLDSENLLDFIPVPDTNGRTPVIPEPGTMALLGIGLAGVGAFSRRHRT